MAKKIKKNLVRIFFALLVFIAFLGFFAKRIRQPLGNLFSPSSSTHKDGVVTAVFDGDTIRVKFNNGVEKKVRLIGVDAPEMDDSREEVAFRAHMAKRFTFYYLYKKAVKLTYDWQLKDTYGRLLAYVWIDKRLFNDFIIREGFAFVFFNFPFREDFQKEFKESEEIARKEERGLWNEGDFLRIRAFNAKRHLGKLISVEYRCASLETKRKFVFIHSSRGEFAALIPQDSLSLFPPYRSFLNRNVLVTGFLEEFKGQPQIVLYFPRQIKIIN